MRQGLKSAHGEREGAGGAAEVSGVDADERGVEVARGFFAGPSSSELESLSEEDSCFVAAFVGLLAGGFGFAFVSSSSESESLELDELSVFLTGFAATTACFFLGGSSSLLSELESSLDDFLAAAFTAGVLAAALAGALVFLSSSLSSLLSSDELDSSIFSGFCGGFALVFAATVLDFCGCSSSSLEPARRINIPVITMSEVFSRSSVTREVFCVAKAQVAKDAA